MDRLNFIGSWTREEGAPTVQQLGDPVIDTPGTRVFDFTTGQTVLVTATSGGNPALLADRRNVFKIGGNWKPFQEKDLRLRAEYVHSRLDRPISTFPGVTAEIEAAFPTRFVRDSTGQLVSVDFRPVNYDEARKDTIRWGFDFTKSLTSARPSQAAIERFRARRPAESRQSGQAGQDAPPQGPAPAGAAPPAEGAGPPPGGFGVVVQAADLADLVVDSGGSEAAVAVRAGGCNSRSLTRSTSSTRSRSVQGLRSSTTSMEMLRDRAEGLRGISSKRRPAITTTGSAPVSRRIGGPARMSTAATATISTSRRCRLSTSGFSPTSASASISCPSIHGSAAARSDWR
ncbi:hypothetical protein H9L15_15625 [Sphingomonas daechungensis]|uniref:Uncharacterized protein n=1 Tax=Sphingomonas daechungensis TaxID=1176646 RepID=A0ABX6T331_9SPHN|nr:hypothetical protein [Sphingomonas daechungensis]QNP43302.1 hypothetical protein H9L15_15625 [Sphingomonas daechungensis]